MGRILHQFKSYNLIVNNAFKKNKTFLRNLYWQINNMKFLLVTNKINIYNTYDQ